MTAHPLPTRCSVIKVLHRSRADHMRPLPFRKLHRKTPHAAGRGMNQDLLIRLEIRRSNNACQASEEAIGKAAA